ARGAAGGSRLALEHDDALPSFRESPRAGRADNAGADDDRVALDHGLRSLPMDWSGRPPGTGGLQMQSAQLRARPDEGERSCLSMRRRSTAARRRALAVALP